MLIVGPVAYLDVTIFQVAKRRNSELRTLGNNLSTRIVLDAHRRLSLSQGDQLVNKNISQVIYLCLVFLIYLFQEFFVLHLGLTSFDGLSK